MKIYLNNRTEEMDRVRRSPLINANLFGRVQSSGAEEIAYVVRKCVAKINEYGIDSPEIDHQYAALLNICGNMKTAKEANSMLSLFDSYLMECPATGELYSIGIRFGVEGDTPKIGYVKRRFGGLLESLDINYLSTFDNWICNVGDLEVLSLESLTRSIANITSFELEV